MPNFIIFALARTGSTSLAKLLNESPDVKMAIEPLHPSFSKWNSGERNYSEFIQDEQTMDQAIDELFSHYSALKILAHQMPEELYTHMFKRKDFKVLFLTRENLVEAALSRLVAGQTQLWQKNDGSLDVEDIEKLEPIDLVEMRKQIEYSQEMIDTYSGVLEKYKAGEYMRLYYEDLYSEDEDENVEIITSICEFLGISLSPNETIQEYMKPSEAKINYGEIYKRLPNYEEVMGELGSDKVL